MEAAEASGWKRMTWRNQAIERNFTFTAWPTGHSLDIVTQWRKLFFFFFKCCVWLLPSSLVFSTLWECCGDVFLWPLSMCANVTTLYNKNTTTTTASHFEEGRVWWLMGVFSLRGFRPFGLVHTRAESLAAELWTHRCRGFTVFLSVYHGPTDCASACFSLEKKRTNKNPTNPFLIYKSCNFFFFFFFFIYIFLFCLLALLLLPKPANS